MMYSEHKRVVCYLILIGVFLKWTNYLIKKQAQSKYITNIVQILFVEYEYKEWGKKSIYTVNTVCI